LSLIALLKVQHGDLRLHELAPVRSEIRFVGTTSCSCCSRCCRSGFGGARAVGTGAAQRVVLASVVLAGSLPIAWLFLSDRWIIPSTMPAPVRFEAR
jgi:hypothetical protein